MPKGKLVAEVLGDLAFQHDRCGLVDFVFAMQHAHRRAKLVLGHLLHADQQPAAMALAARPSFDELVDLPPTAQVEVAHAIICSLGESELTLREPREHWAFDIVEDSGHSSAVNPGLRALSWRARRPDRSKARSTVLSADSNLRRPPEYRGQIEPVSFYVFRLFFGNPS